MLDFFWFVDFVVLVVDLSLVGYVRFDFVVGKIFVNYVILCFVVCVGIYCMGVRVNEG